MKLFDKAKEKFSARRMKVECVYGPPSMLMGKDDRTGKQNYRPELDIIQGVYGPPTEYNIPVKTELLDSPRSGMIDPDADNNVPKDKKEEDSD